MSVSQGKTSFCLPGCIDLKVLLKRSARGNLQKSKVHLTILFPTNANLRRNNLAGPQAKPSIRTNNYIHPMLPALSSRERRSRGRGLHTIGWVNGAKQESGHFRI